jgi:hypothetical protein
VTPVPASTINSIETAFDNLALIASNDTTILQQLTSANLALMASVASLMMANKKRVEALTKKGVAMPAKATVLRGCVQQTRLSWVIIAGPTEIGSANTTQVQPAGTRPRGRRTR